MNSVSPYRTFCVFVAFGFLLCEIAAFARVDNYPQRRPNATQSQWPQPGHQQPSQNWNAPGAGNQWIGGNSGQYNQSYGGNNNWPRNNNTQSAYNGGVGNQLQGQQQPQHGWSNSPQQPQVIVNPWFKHNQTSAYPNGFNNNNNNQTNANGWGSSGFGQNGWKNPQQYPGGPPAFGGGTNNIHQQNPAPLAPLGPIRGADGSAPWNSSGPQQRPPASGINPYVNLFY